VAEALVTACEGESQFKFLYDLNLPIEEKITTIAKEIYRADGIELSDLARQQIETYTRQGYSNLPSSYSRPPQLCLLVGLLGSLTT
jgi:methylenetetrahydrofolate dehydrogenase (NADP+)/methenyltetrahydrofolate cyclohydrolase/formyltetrahydrofolate synthetase